MIMIYINFVKLAALWLHVKLQDPRPPILEKKIFKVFFFSLFFTVLAVM